MYAVLCHFYLKPVSGVTFTRNKNTTVPSCQLYFHELAIVVVKDVCHLYSAFHPLDTKYTSICRSIESMKIRYVRLRIMRRICIDEAISSRQLCVMLWSPMRGHFRILHTKIKLKILPSMDDS